jgi:hypothetical protein
LQLVARACSRQHRTTLDEFDLSSNLQGVFVENSTVFVTIEASEAFKMALVRGDVTWNFSRHAP